MTTAIIDAWDDSIIDAEAAERRVDSSQSEAHEQVHHPDPQSSPPDCPICLDSAAALQMAILAPCTHQTCSRCIEKWTQFHHTCPICRAPIQRVLRSTRAPPGAKKKTTVGANRSRLDALALSQGVQQGFSMAAPPRQPRSRADDAPAAVARRNPRSVLELDDDELLDVCVDVEDKTLLQLEQAQAKKERRWLERPD